MIRRVVCSLVELIREAQVTVKCGHTGNCFSNRLKVGDVIDEDHRLIQVIDARGSLP